MPRLILKAATIAKSAPPDAAMVRLIRRYFQRHPERIGPRERRLLAELDAHEAYHRSATFAKAEDGAPCIGCHGPQAQHDWIKAAHPHLGEQLGFGFAPATSAGGGSSGKRLRPRIADAPPTRGSETGRGVPATLELPGLRREVQRPGIRGALYWIDEHGKVRYDERPQPAAPAEGAWSILEALAKQAQIRKEQAKADAEAAAKVSTRVEITDAHHGQVDGYVLATRGDGTQVGRLNFSSFRGEVLIQMVEVPAAFRRQGIAMRLFRALQAEFPDQKLDPGYRTEDGDALWNAWVAQRSEQARWEAHGKIGNANAERVEAQGFTIVRAADGDPQAAQLLDLLGTGWEREKLARFGFGVTHPDVLGAAKAEVDKRAAYLEKLTSDTRTPEARVGSWQRGTTRWWYAVRGSDPNAEGSKHIVGGFKTKHEALAAAEANHTGSVEMASERLRVAQAGLDAIERNTTVDELAREAREAYDNASDYYQGLIGNPAATGEMRAEALAHAQRTLGQLMRYGGFAELPEDPERAAAEAAQAAAEQAEKERQQRADPKRAAKLRAAADAMQAQIDYDYNPGIANQNVTHRRARIAGGMFARAQQAEKVQGVLRNLADQVEEGTAHRLLAGINSAGDVRRLLSRWSKFGGTPHANERNISDVIEYLDLADLRARAEVPSATIDAWRDAMKAAQARFLVGGKYDAEGRERYRVEFTPDEAHAYTRAVRLLQKIRPYTRPPQGSWDQSGRIYMQYDYALEGVRNAKREGQMGITSAEDFETAKAEIQKLVGPQKVDPRAAIKKLERELLGSKYPGYFPTPRTLGDAVVERAQIEPGMTVLEPSAGKGDLVEAIRDAHPDAKVDAIELVPKLREILEAKGIPVVGHDSFTHEGQYDRIVMNPPFEGGADCDHIRHAFDKLLKPGGRLVAIMSEGPFFRSDRKATEFRAWLEAQGGISERNPEGAFSKNQTTDRITGVATRTIVVDKPAAVKADPFVTGRVYETTTGDYTGRIHYARRADGQWFERFQERDPRYGYRWGAWRAVKAPPERLTPRAVEFPKQARLPGGTFAKARVGIRRLILKATQLSFLPLLASKKNPAVRRHQQLFAEHGHEADRRQAEVFAAQQFADESRQIEGRRALKPRPDWAHTKNRFTADQIAALASTAYEPSVHTESDVALWRRFDGTPLQPGEWAELHRLAKLGAIEPALKYGDQVRTVPGAADPFHGIVVATHNEAPEYGGLKIKVRDDSRTTDRTSMWRQASEFERIPDAEAAAARVAAKRASRRERLLAWFGASKVVKPNGDPLETYKLPYTDFKRHILNDDGTPPGPLVVYHGSPAAKQITAFDPSKPDPHALYGPGFYFTESEKIARGYAAKHARARLSDAGAKQLAAFVRKRLPEGVTLTRSRYRMHGMMGSRWIATYHLTNAEGRLAPGIGEDNLAFASEMDGGDAVPGRLPKILGWDAHTTELWERHCAAAGWTIGDDADVLACYLKIEKPFDVDTGRVAPADLPEAYRGHDIDRPELSYDDLVAVVTLKNRRALQGRNPLVEQVDEPPPVKDEVNALLRQLGYDGITHVGGIISGQLEKHRVWIAFAPTQIKAVDNVGTFDPADPDIRKAATGWRRLILKAQGAFQFLPLVASKRNPKVRRRTRLDVQPAPAERMIDLGRLRVQLHARGPITFRGATVEHAADLADAFRAIVDHDRERFWTVLLRDDRLLGVECVSVGTLNASLVHPREMLKGALALGANRLAVIHNHPSGDPTPSPEDIAITERLGRVCHTMGMQPLTSLVVAGEGWAFVPKDRADAVTYADHYRRRPWGDTPAGSYAPPVIAGVTQRGGFASGDVLNSPDRVAELGRRLLKPADAMAIAVVLDSKGRILATPTLRAGGALTAQDAAECIRQAVVHNAAAVAIVAGQDGETWQRALPAFWTSAGAACADAGLQLHDLIEVGRGGFTAHSSGGGWSPYRAPVPRAAELATQEATILKALIEAEEDGDVAGLDPEELATQLLACRMAKAHLNDEYASMHARFERQLRQASPSAHATHPLEGTRSVDGLSIAIENQVGSVRTWKNHDGTTGSRRMLNPYGYVRGSLGTDGDHVDCFLGPLATSEQVKDTTVYVITINFPPLFTQVDEQKCMIGWRDEGAARRAFLRNYGGEERFIRQIDALPWDEFKAEVRRTREEGGAFIRGAVVFAKAVAFGRSFAHLPLLPSKRNPNVKRHQHPGLPRLPGLEEEAWNPADPATASSASTSTPSGTPSRRPTRASSTFARPSTTRRIDSFAPGRSPRPPLPLFPEYGATSRRTPTADGRWLFGGVDPVAYGLPVRPGDWDFYAPGLHVAAGERYVRALEAAHGLRVRVARGKSRPSLYDVIAVHEALASMPVAVFRSLKRADTGDGLEVHVTNRQKYIRAGGKTFREEGTFNAARLTITVRGRTALGENNATRMLAIRATTAHEAGHALYDMLHRLAVVKPETGARELLDAFEHASETEGPCSAYAASHRLSPTREFWQMGSVGHEAAYWLSENFAEMAQALGADDPQHREEVWAAMGKNRTRAAFGALVGFAEGLRGGTTAGVERAFTAVNRRVAPTRPRRLILKAHVGAYTRTSAKTGAQVQVAEHDDRRASAQPRVPHPRMPAAPAPMGMPRMPAAPAMGGGMRPPAMPAAAPGGGGMPQQAAPPPEPLRANDIDHQAIGEHIAGYRPILEKGQDLLASYFPGVPVGGRLKETASLAGKIQSKRTGKPEKGIAPRPDYGLHNVEDTCGLRLEFKSQEEQLAAVARIKHYFAGKVKSEDDYLTKPKGGVYRSYHMILDIDGKPAELQIRTAAQTAWADWTHDTIYKEHHGPPPPEAEAYAAAMSQYVQALDTGQDPGELPECPENVKMLYGCMVMPDTEPQPQAEHTPEAKAERKRMAAELPDDIGKLEENHGKYFTATPGAMDLPLHQIKPIRAREEGIKNAEKFMKLAYDGKQPRRQPVRVMENDDHTFTLLDGNSTHAIATKHGWKTLRAVKVSRKKGEAMLAEAKARGH